MGILNSTRLLTRTTETLPDTFRARTSWVQRLHLFHAFISRVVIVVCYFRGHTWGGNAACQQVAQVSALYFTHTYITSALNLCLPYVVVAVHRRFLYCLSHQQLWAPASRLAWTRLQAAESNNPGFQSRKAEISLLGSCPTKSDNIF